MLFASLLACVGVMKAQIPTASTAPADGEWNADTKWYSIMCNDGTKGYVSVNYVDADGNLQLNNATKPAADGLWCVVGNETDGFSFYNYAAGTAKVLGATGREGQGRMKMYDTNAVGSDVTTCFDFATLQNQTGYAFVKNHGSSNDWWNNRDGYLAYWNSSNAYGEGSVGSQYVFTEVTDFFAFIDIAAAKEAAKAELNNCASVSALYPTSTNAVAEVEAVEAASNGLADLNAAIEEINAIVTNYKNAAYQALAGKYFTINTSARSNGGYMEMTSSKVVGVASEASPADYWQFVYNNGKVNVYNPYTKKYLGEPGNSSTDVAVTANQAEAAAYDLVVVAEHNDAPGALIKLTSNGKSVHMDGSFNLVRWDNGAASQWIITEVSDFTAVINGYKAATIATLDEWATLSVVFDAALIASAKEALEAINTTDFATFALIDAALVNVTEKVAEKYFTFRNSDLASSSRVDAYLAANMNDNEGHGTQTFGYNAIWRLISVGGTSFYLYNELNDVYLGSPSSNGDLTAEPGASYSFEIVDVETSKAELKCGSETLHLNNHTDGLLSNYDENVPASRWYIATYDFKADLRTLLDGVDSDDYAEVPALGQYPTAAYNALVEANENATTVVEVAEAIAAFHASLNRPVYFITSKHDDYAAGSAVYYDGANWKWKTANIYDRQMWMIIPGYTEENVPVVDAYDASGTHYEICDYLTGTVMRGKSVQIVKIEDWADAYNLQYGTTTNDAVQHAQAATWGSNVVGWNPATATDNKASAWGVEYIGNTYDLDKLTDEHITALAELKTACINKGYAAGAVFGNGLGQYQNGDKSAIVAVVEAGEAILAKSLVEQAAMNVADINTATTAINEVADLAINLPEAGKYYRFQGACAAVKPNYYITGHTNADGGRIACTEEADASTIFYFDGTNLVAYQSGLCIGLNSGHWTFASVDDNSKPASKITFAASPRTAGAYTIYSADRYLHYFYYSGDGMVQVNRCQEDTDAEHDWYITEVTTLPVTISEAGYATFYAPVEVTLPEGVTAHTVTANGEWATLSEAISVVPAENGVILTGEAGTYDFAITTTGAADLENALAGTIAKTLVAKTEGDAYYVLAKKDENVGLYNPTKGEDTASFYNAGHKAYWHIPAVAQSAGYHFGDGTTSIEQIAADAELVIYDLAGRRVEKMEKGIYIVNGKKVIK